MLYHLVGSSLTGSEICDSFKPNPLRSPDCVRKNPQANDYLAHYRDDPPNEDERTDK